VQLSIEGFEDYLGRVAQLLERYGAVLDLSPGGALAIEETPSGAVSFALRGFLPDGRIQPLSTVEVREVWRRAGLDAVERWEYEYELIDHERGFRRAFHLHDRDAWLRRFQVAVHEHCERPIGVAPCQHIAGLPVRDAFRGIELLLAAWVDPDPPDCRAMTCLDDTR
jgi:hypothetical protein